MLGACPRAATAQHRIGSLSAVRGGDAAYALSPSVQQEVLVVFPDATFSTTDYLSDEYLENVDLVLLGVTYDGGGMQVIISTDEQKALRNYVCNGKGAILFGENSAYAASTSALMETFGCAAIGGYQFPSSGLFYAPEANPISNGDFGNIESLDGAWAADLISNGGAVVIARGGLGAALLPYGGLRNGSGGVVMFGDSLAYNLTPDNVIALRNSISYAGKVQFPHLRTGIRMGSLNGSRAGDAAYAEHWEVQDIVRSVFADATFSSADTLNDEFLRNIDVVIVGVTYDGGGSQVIISPDEQNALRKFVLNGKGAILFGENSAYYTGTYALLNPFGCYPTGGYQFPSWGTFYYSEANPVSQGDSGRILRVDGAWAADLFSSGPANVITYGGLGVALAPYGALGKGSGGVVMFADSIPYYLTTENVIALQNSLAYVGTLQGVEGATPVTPLITWTKPSNISYGTPLSGNQLNATASDPKTGLAVPGVFAYSPPPGTVLAVGSDQLLAVEFTPETGNYTAASSSTTITIDKAATILNLSSSANPALVGSSLVLTATVSPSGASGVVQFVDDEIILDTATISQGQAFLTYTALTPGVHSIQALYQGNGQYLGSSFTISQTVKQTITVTIRLTDSAGNPLSGGKAQYYASGWRDIGITGADGKVSIELPPSSYTFSIDYAFGRRTLVQNVVTSSTVLFQTQRTTARLTDSTGNPLVGGSAQYYASGWHDIGLTGADGTTSIELLPLSYAFAVTYNGGRIQNTQDVSGNPIVLFSTKRLTVKLINSSSSPLPGGAVQYYANGWKDLGITDIDGNVTAEIVPNNYAFAVSYAGGRVQQNQDLSGDPLVVFQTVRTTVKLADSVGNPIAGGTAKYYASGWKNIGPTGADGTVSTELLPNSYAFSLDFRGGHVQINQNIATTALVMFSTSRVHSNSGRCTQYYGQGWVPFTNDMELLAASYTFKFSDGTPNTPYSISGTVYNIQ